MDNGHEYYVNSVVISPDGKWVASADLQSVILWRTEDGSILEDRSVSITLGRPIRIAVQFTPEHQHLVTWDGYSLIVRDKHYPFHVVAQTPPQQDLEEHCIFSHDKALCALYGSSGPEKQDFSIRVCSTETAEIMLDQRIRLGGSAHWRPDREPDFSSDSRRLLWTQNIDESTNGVACCKSISWIWDIYSSGPPRKLMTYGTGRVQRSSCLHWALQCPGSPAGRHCNVPACTISGPHAHFSCPQK